MKNYLHLAFLAILMMFTSCSASFLPINNPHHLTNSNIKSLNGEYNVNPSQDTLIAGCDIYSRTKNLFTLFDRRKFEPNFYAKSKAAKIKIEVQNEHRAKITYLEKDSIVRELIVKSQIKEDGYLYLENQNTKILGVPFVFGAIDDVRIRLTKNKENNLIVDVANHRSGAVLLVVFLSVNNIIYRQIHQKIK